MKKPYLAALFVALVTMNLGAQEPSTTPDPTPARLIKAMEADKTTEVSNIPGLADYATAAFALPKAERTREQNVVLARLSWEHNVGDPLVSQAVDEYPETAAYIARKLTASQIRAQLFGNPLVDADLVYIASLRLSAPELCNDLCVSLLGKGSTSPRYARWFKSQLLQKADEEQIPILEAEIRGLLSRTQSASRDALLVEYRAQRLVLKELAK